MTAAEIDETILRILLGSEHGRRWLDDAERSVDLTRRLDGLRQRGVSDQVVSALREGGSLELVEQVEAMPFAAIAGLNSVAAFQMAEPPPPSHEG